MTVRESAALVKATISIQLRGRLPTRRLPTKLSRCGKHSVGVLLDQRPNSLTEASERIASVSECYLVQSSRFAGTGEVGSRECDQRLHCIVVSCRECYEAGIRCVRSTSRPEVQSAWKGSVLWHFMSPSSESRRLGELEFFREGLDYDPRVSIACLREYNEL